MLSGAGLSTASGLPDFRSAASGVWERFDPERLAHVASLDAVPGDVWDFYAWRVAMLDGVRPNPAHAAIAELVARGAVAGVATQNVDGLHAASGVDAIELHGSLRWAECRRCGDVEAIGEALARRADGEPAACASCGALLKPGVVMFGEALPEGAWRAAHDLMAGARLALVVGTSLAVAPANRLPALVDGPVVVCTRELAPGASQPDVWTDAPLERLLPALAAAVLER